MTRPSIAEMFIRSLPAPDTKEEAALYQIAEYVFADFATIADTLGKIAAELHAISQSLARSP